MPGMKNPVTLVLGLAVAVLAAFAYLQSTGLKEHEKQLTDARTKVQELDVKLAAKAASEALDLQARCAKQADEAFRIIGLAKNRSAGYISHYNRMLGKCFIKTMDNATYDKTLWTYKTLVDAFELKQYGDYMWHTDPPKKAWEVPPFTCTVTLPSGEEKACNSDAEFEALVKEYMEK